MLLEQVVITACADFGPGLREEWQPGELLSAQRRQIGNQLLVQQTISTHHVFCDRQPVCVPGKGRHVADLRTYIGECHLRQNAGIIFLRLTLFQRLRTFNNRLLIRIAQRTADDFQLLLFQPFHFIGQFSIRAQRETHAVTVIQQQTLHGLLHKARLRCAGTQTLKSRVQIQQRRRIAIMSRGRQGVKHQLQAIGIMIAADFALV